MNNTFGEVINRCVSKYCNAPSSALGKCRNIDEDRRYTLTLGPVVDFYSKTCIGVNNHVNTDIACTLWSPTGNCADQLGPNIIRSANHDHSIHLAGPTTSLAFSSSSLVHTTNMKPWYTLLRSTITILLSIATSHMSNHWPAFSIARWSEFARRNSGLHECGNRPLPLVWCARRSNGESSVAEISTSLVVISLSCHGLLVLIQVGPWAKQILLESNTKLYRTFQHFIDRFPPQDVLDRLLWF